MSNPKRSLATRIWLIVLLAIFLSTGSFCVVAFVQANKAIYTSTRQRMLDIANCAAGSVDGDTLERLGPDSVLNPGYRRVYNALAIFRDNIEADSVYGMKQEEYGRFIITVDPSLEDAGEFGHEVVETPALIKAGQGESAVDEEPYTDEWGTFYSAYSPVYNSNKEIVGVVGVDFTREWYEGQMTEQAKKMFALFLAALCLTLLIVGLLCAFLISSITKPMKQIAEVAECYRKGDYSKKLEINREDELGVLSHALQTMATSLTERIEEADAANRAKSNFLANMSHEIRTPINAVLGMNEMILRESSDPDIRVYSENVKTAGSTLLSIINDILDFSKIEAGKLEIIPLNYDLSSVINDLVNMIHTRADDKGLELKLELDRNTPKQLNGDSVRIRQVITNILTNAVKYTEKGSITFRLGYEKNEDEPDSILLNVSVKDTGIGIKEEDLKKLFSEFERIEEQRNRNIEGTGLGMSITKNLLEMMGSVLKVESVYGEGSNFYFSLKQKVVGDEVLGDYEGTYRANLDKASKYREKFIAPRAHILVVDDTPMNLQVFKNLLKQTKVQIETADGGDKALAIMRKKKYDIIFLDHMMPHKDGIMTLKEMKQEKDNPNLETVTVCLTANAISGAKDKYLEAGFDDYLTKPINPEKLENMLINYLPDDLIEMVGEEPDESEELSDYVFQMLEDLTPLLNQSLINLKHGIHNNGTVDAYLPVLKVFYESVDAKAEELSKFYSEEDFENYKIKVHALKSSARIIGAEGLGDSAQRLEDAGTSKDYDFIRAHHDEFMEEYNEIKELVASVFEGKNKRNKPLAADWLMTEAYNQIKYAAKEMDCDGLEVVFDEMEGYAIPEEAAELWNNLKKAYTTLDYDAMISLIENSKPAT